MACLPAWPRGLRGAEIPTETLAPALDILSRLVVQLLSTLVVRRHPRQPREWGDGEQKINQNPRETASTTQNRARRATSPNLHVTSRPSLGASTTPNDARSQGRSAAEELAAAAAAAYLSKAVPAPAIAEESGPTKRPFAEPIAPPSSEAGSTSATESAAPGGGCAEAFTLIEPQGSQPRTGEMRPTRLLTCRSCSVEFATVRAVTHSNSKGSLTSKVFRLAADFR